MTEKITRMEANLQRKLDWIGRSDTRVAFTASVTVAMLGVLATAGGNIKVWERYLYVIFGLAFILLFASLIFIYVSQYPKTRSTNTSLIYFGTIAELREDNFNRKVKACTDDEYLDDLISQTHINAKILDWKFRYIKIALILILSALVPWLCAIYFSKLYIN